MNSRSRQTWYLFLISIFFLLYTPYTFAKTVVISWDANTEADLAGYEIHYGTNENQLSQSVNVGNQTEFEFSQLNEGNTYYFAVLAYDNSNNKSGLSDIVNIALPETKNNGDNNTDSNGGGTQDSTNSNATHHKIAGTSLTLQGENFEEKDGYSIVDATTYNFQSAGYISWSVAFDSTAEYEFSFKAKSSDFVQGEWANLQISLNDEVLSETVVDASEFKIFSTKQVVNQGAYTLKIAFTNDYYDSDSGEDRNLILDYFEISDINASIADPDTVEGDTTPTETDSVAADSSGNETVPSDSTDQVQTIPSETFALNQNYPNPFNPSTKISFELYTDSFIELKVYDVLGRRVKTVFAGELSPGNHNFSWNARDDQGNELTSGVYFYVLEALSIETSNGSLGLKSAKRETKTMIYMR